MVQLMLNDLNNLTHCYTLVRGKVRFESRVLVPKPGLLNSINTASFESEQQRLLFHCMSSVIAYDKDLTYHMYRGHWLQTGALYNLSA